jgi:predicted transcriptional regulator
VGTSANSLLDQTKEVKMRRVTLMLTAMAMMVLLFAVVAYAAEIVGTDNSETITETNMNDEIHALVGEDSIDAALYQAIGDRDRVHGNKGADFIDVADQDTKDTAWGGKGDDDCWGDTGDTFISCELINGNPVD